jgi:hypothetical protein
MRAAPPADPPGETAPCDSRFRWGGKPQALIGEANAKRRTETEQQGGGGEERVAFGADGRASERWCGPRRFIGDLGINRAGLVTARRRVTLSAGLD